MKILLLLLLSSITLTGLSQNRCVLNDTLQFYIKNDTLFSGSETCYDSLTKYTWINTYKKGKKTSSTYYDPLMNISFQNFYADKVNIYLEWEEGVITTHRVLTKIEKNYYDSYEYNWNYYVNYKGTLNALRSHSELKDSILKVIGYDYNGKVSGFLKCDLKKNCNCVGYGYIDGHLVDKSIYRPLQFLKVDAGKKADIILKSHLPWPSPYYHYGPNKRYELGKLSEKIFYKDGLVVKHIEYIRKPGHFVHRKITVPSGPYGEFLPR